MRRAAVPVRLAIAAIVTAAPLLAGFATLTTTFDRAQDVEFCGSCHTMSDYIHDVTDEASKSLAGAHHANRWIADDTCYTCHTAPGPMGMMGAKLRGLRHSAAYYLWPDRIHVELYSAYPNESCTQCHDGARGYDSEMLHDLMADELASGEASCVETDCHASVHHVKPTS